MTDKLIDDLGSATTPFTGAERFELQQGSTGTQPTLKGLLSDIGAYVYGHPAAPAQRIVTASGAVTIASTDGIVFVNKTVGAATTVNVDPTTVKQQFTVKDAKGDAGTNNITITPASGTIDGQSTAVINVNYGALTIVYNGSELSILA